MYTSDSSPEQIENTEQMYIYATPTKKFKFKNIFKRMAEIIKLEIGKTIGGVAVTNKQPSSKILPPEFRQFPHKD